MSATTTKTAVRNLTGYEIDAFKKVELQGLAHGADGAWKTGEKLAELKQASGLQQKELARQLGKSSSYVSRMLAARKHALAVWKGCPSTADDCRTFMALAYGNIARIAAQNSADGKANAKGKTPWTERIARACRAAVSEGASDTEIHAAVTTAVQAARAKLAEASQAETRPVAVAASITSQLTDRLASLSADDRDALFALLAAA